MKESHIFAVDVVLIVGSLLTLIVVIGYSTPLVISPIENDSFSQALFSIEHSEMIILLDNNNQAFSQTIFLFDNVKFSLNPGSYTIKIISETYNETRTLDTDIPVSFVVKQLGNTFYVYNAQENNIHVQVYNKSRLVDSYELESTGDKT